MKIPVFVSCPTSLSKAQEQSRKVILDQLDKYQLEPRAIGRSDYPTELPLREVLVLAKHCSGGIILGFEQFLADGGVRKRSTKEESKVKDKVPFPTPWNHLESGILFGLQLPILVFREEGISGGVFDPGVTDVFVHKMPSPKASEQELDGLDQLFLKWQSRVRTHYYADSTF